VKTAIDVGAKAIIVLSETGNTARMVAKFRPGIPIAVLTPSESVARQSFGVYKGCYAFTVDSLEDTDALVNECTNEIRLAGVANEGDPFVVVCGKSFGRGATNQIKVEYVQSNYWDEGAGESDMTAHHRGRESGHKGCSIM
jgi:pyruvate kinase